MKRCGNQQRVGKMPGEGDKCIMKLCNKMRKLRENADLVIPPCHPFPRCTVERIIQHFVMSHPPL